MTRRGRLSIEKTARLNSLRDRVSRIGQERFFREIRPGSLSGSWRQWDEVDDAVLWRLLDLGWVGSVPVEIAKVMGFPVQIVRLHIRNLRRERMQWASVRGKLEDRWSPAELEELRIVWVRYRSRVRRLTKSVVA